MDDFGIELIGDDFILVQVGKPNDFDDLKFRDEVEGQLDNRLFLF